MTGKHDFSSMERLLELGMGITMAKQMMDAVNAINDKAKTPNDPKDFFQNKLFKVCSNCGRYNYSVNKFCGDCGTKLSSNERICDKCNTANDTDAKFCSNCGKDMKKLKCQKCGTENTLVSKFCKECGGALK